MTDIPGNSSTGATIAVGGSVTDSLEVTGDHDWFAITLTAGQSIDVTVNGITLDDPYLYIRDSAGNLLFSNDDIVSGINRNSEVKFSASYTGTYYIDVGAYADSSTGSYQLSVQPYTPPPLATLDQIANQLVSGFWGGDSHHFAVTQGGTITVNISTLNGTEQNLARAALQEWTDIIGVQFREVTTGGQIVFSNAEGSNGPMAATDANWSGGITTSAHIQISSSWVTRYGSGLNTYSFQAYVHEIGHALGLGHAGDYNNEARYPYDALFQNDAWSTSIMSYFDQNDNTYFGGLGFTVNFAVTPMGADILAMQQLYGLSTTSRTGDTVYGYNSNAGGVYDANNYPAVAYTIFDSGGIDTIDYSNTPAVQTINLNPETFSNVNGYTGNLSIARGVVIENAIGGSGADTIIGNAAANVLTGRSGTDTLTGGAGSDTFLDTKAGHNGDTITDFGAGDSIVFSDATLASFTFSLSGHTLTYTGGSLTLSSIPAQAIVASAAASGGVQLTVATAVVAGDAVHNDFNGDGRSDILWRNDNGALTDWLGTTTGGFTPNSANVLTVVDNSWQIAATGDFNGDLKVDILWHRADGAVTDWLGTASGGFTPNGANLLTVVDPQWQIAGVGDFNGDGRDDVLWRRADGSLTDWLGTASGGLAPNGNNLLTVVDPQWHVAGIGDFNGDGKDDVLWHRTDGALTDWLGTASGGLAPNGANLLTVVDPQWQIAGVGDFNGDGRDDVLWHRTDGALTDWLGTANGGLTPNGNNLLTIVDLQWQIAAIGDYNGDGRDDVLWRNNDGRITDWLGTSNGAFTDNFANAYQAVDTHWHVQPPEFLL